jgi:hypothetical protein
MDTTKKLKRFRKNMVKHSHSTMNGIVNMWDFEKGTLTHVSDRNCGRSVKLKNVSSEIPIAFQTYYKVVV